MNAGRRLMWVTLLATLLLGVGTGVLVDRFLLSSTVFSSGSDQRERWRDRRAHFLTELRDELALDPEQARAVERVLEANHGTARRFWAESRRDFEALREQFRSDIRNVLMEDQAERFDALLAAREARRRDRKGREDD